MPPKGRRRLNDGYQVGQYVEFEYKHQIVAGKLLRCNPHKQWTVQPTDRRRRNETVPELALGAVISVREAMEIRAPKTGKKIASEDDRAVTPSPQDDEGAKGAKSSAAGAAGAAGQKRKNGGDDTNRQKLNDGKAVSFTQKSAPDAMQHDRKMNKAEKNAADRKKYGTRSSRGDGVLLTDAPVVKKKRQQTGRKIKKEDNCQVVKLKTGTLYLYRGENPRAEFVRNR
mmetsp:Transcript_22500/g.53079  ORF Transcript_22500/g.53079 Transcript_22500/m.53079 type:complete len:227 (+) Transcript_22500:161-841(+)